MAEPAKPAGPARYIEPLEWQDAVERIRPYVVKIVTPYGSGTGFLFTYAVDPSLCGIATAAHVVERAHTWENPIRIEHSVSGKSAIVRVHERSITLDHDLDTAALIMQKGEIPFPDEVLPLIPKGRSVKVGVEVGWVGFPALASDNLCFFSGRISTRTADSKAYLVDGVAINGVSGGPAFLTLGSAMDIVGVLSAYIPNRATGEALPGVCVITDVKQFQTLIEAIRSLEEAKEKETPPIEAQTSSPDEGETLPVKPLP